MPLLSNGQLHYKLSDCHTSFRGRYSCQIIRQSLSPLFYCYNISWAAQIISFLNTKCIHAPVTTFLLGPNGPKLLVQSLHPRAPHSWTKEFWSFHRTVFWDVTSRRQVNQDVSKKSASVFRGKAPWRMSKWFLAGRWARLVQRRRVNSGHQIY
jgi:hypothetical protein